MKTAEQILRTIFPAPKNEAEKNDDENIIKAMEEYRNQKTTLPIADIKSVCKHDYVKTGLEGELYCYKCNSTLPIADSDNELDSLNFDRLKTLLSFSKKYEISVQFWPDQTAVYISKDGVELKSYGGGFKFAVQSSIDYLNRINNIG